MGNQVGVQTMWLIPSLCVVAFGVIFWAGATRSSRSGTGDQQVRSLISSERVAELREQLGRAPVAVLGTRRPSRILGNDNHVVLDIGNRLIDAWCFWPPNQPISIVRGLRFRNEIGWEISIEGPRGPGRLFAWRLDVR